MGEERAQVGGWSQKELEQKKEKLLQLAKLHLHVPSIFVLHRSTKLSHLA